MKPYEYSVSQSLKHLATGEISSKELTESCLKRIDETESELSSFVLVNREAALVQADTEDKKRAEGKQGVLSGIPVSLKDLLCTKNITTTCGSKILENFVPPYSATVVEKLEKEGAVVIGKTTMDEFAMGSTSETCSFGVPKNPWNTEYVAGGSSGGAATSVASGQCLASLGSDTGGSIRQPASLCGIVGLKPTYGRISRYGLVAFASSLDQIGPLTRDVKDCSLLLECISGYDERDSTSVKREEEQFTDCLIDGLRGIKVGVPREYFGEGLESDVEKAITHNIELLKDCGAEIVEISLPHTDYCVAVYYLIAPAEASSNLARFDGVVYGHRDKKADSLMEMYKETRSSGFGDEVKRRILIGTYALSSGYYDAYYKKASQVRTIILNDFRKAFQSCDVIISPVTPTPAWKIGEKSEDPLALYLSDVFSLSANLAGIPALSVPGGFSKKGMPIGVQLQGPHFREDSLLRVAHNIEKNNNFSNKLPRI